MGNVLGRAAVVVEPVDDGGVISRAHSTEPSEPRYLATMELFAPDRSRQLRCAFSFSVSSGAETWRKSSPTGMESLSVLVGVFDDALLDL